MRKHAVNVYITEEDILDKFHPVEGYEAALFIDAKVNLIDNTVDITALMLKEGFDDSKVETGKIKRFKLINKELINI